MPARTRPALRLVLAVESAAQSRAPSALIDSSNVFDLGGTVANGLFELETGGLETGGRMGNVEGVVTKVTDAWDFPSGFS